MRTRTVAAAVLACTLALTACTDGDGADPSRSPTATTASASPTPEVSPIPSPSPSPTPSPTPSDTASTTPSPTPTAAAVPDDLSTIADDGEVTLAEAQAVIDAQDQIYNDAVITLLTRPEDIQGGPSVEFFDELAEIYTEPLRNVYADAWADLARQDFAGLNTSDPSGVSNSVSTVISTGPTCFFAQMERDANGIADKTEQPQQYWVSLRTDGESLLDSPNGWHRDIEGLDEPDDGEDFCDRRATP